MVVVLKGTTQVKRVVESDITESDYKAYALLPD